MKKLIAYLLTLCLCMSMIPVFGASEMECPLSAEEFETLAIVNQERQKEKLPPLTSLPELQRGADIRTREIVSVTEHTRPDGEPWYTVFDELQAPPYSWAGENIAAGQRSPTAVMNAWMNSEGHRANILNANYVHLGLGYVYENESYYKTYWVQLFFTGHNCSYTGMTLGFFADRTAYVGTGIEDLDLVACLQCKNCGTAYLPVLADYCSGYNPATEGTQKVTVSVLGQTATINVELQSLPQETEPTEPTEEPTEPTEEPTEPTEPPVFNDLEEGSWYEESVNYMVQQGLMNGVGNGRFNPTGKVTRAMLVTILYRVEGSPSVAGFSNPFTDVPQAWYTDAVIWAASEGIVTGVKPDRFNPNGNITREQIATILYRYEGSPEAPDTLPPFADNRQISAYALRPMNWAISEGLINGVGGGFLAPGNTATRAQIATILARYLQK